VNAFADIAGVAPQEIWPGVVARAVDGERMTMALIELDPGTVVPEHAHDQEQLGILLSGSLAFTVGAEAEEVLAGGTWRILANVPHAVEAGPEGAVAVEIWSPLRDDWHRLDRGGPTRPRWPPLP
jgi:quercetin dioxygenase-like cupin family protein